MSRHEKRNSRHEKMSTFFGDNSRSRLNLFQFIFLFLLSFSLYFTGFVFSQAHSLENISAEGLSDFRETLAGELEKMNRSFLDIKEQFKALPEQEKLVNECMEKRFEQVDSLLEICAKDIRTNSPQSLFFACRGISDFKVFEHFLRQKLLLAEVNRQKSVRLNVRDFGAKGDGISDDSPAFFTALSKARSLDAAPVIVEIPAGKFLLTGKWTKYDGAEMRNVRTGSGTMNTIMTLSANLPIWNIQNLIIEGKGDETELICDAEHFDGISLIGGRNVTLRNFTLRNRQQTFAQGKILRIDREKNSIDLLIDHGYPLDSNRGGFVQFYDEKTGKLLKTASGKFFDHMEKLDNQTRRIHIYRALSSSTDKLHALEPGQIFVIAFRQHGGTLRIMNSAYCTLENLRVLNSFDTAFFLGFNDGMIVSQCRVEPAAGAFLSSNADAFHCWNPQGLGVYMSGCVTRSMGDDAFNTLCIGQYLVDAAGKTIWAVTSAGAPDGTEPSDDIAFVSPVDGKIKGWAKILSKKKAVRRGSPCVQYELDREVPANLVTYQSLNIPIYSASELHQMQLGGEIGEEPDNLFPLSKGGIGAVVRNCDFASNRNNGIVVHVSHCRVENNRVENMAIGIRSGVFLTWKEGFLPYNVVLRGNAIADSMYAIQISCVTKKELVAPDTPMFRYFTIENNTFLNSPVFLGNLSESVFSDNKFIDNSNRCILSLRGCDKITVKGNTLNGNVITKDNMVVKKVCEDQKINILPSDESYK